MLIMSIETSCDETAAAVIENGQIIHSNVVASQAEMHSKFGGIIPEMAAREHMINLIPVIDQALKISGATLKDIDAIGVTNGPGLAGSLLVGVNTAKGIAFPKNIPIQGINHLEGHIYASWLEENNPDTEFGFPILCLIASGGHSDLVLMNNHQEFKLIARTRDDAAGEAFDKGARILGLPYPGGPSIQKAAEDGCGENFHLPRPKINNSLDFSFSGLKTALIREVQQLKNLTTQNKNDLAYSFQEAITDTLIRNTLQAAEMHNVKGILIVGGVAANQRLREEIKNRAQLPLMIPKVKFCTDNAAMIGAAAFYRMQNNIVHEWDMDVIPNLSL